MSHNIPKIQYGSGPTEIVFDYPPITKNGNNPEEKDDKRINKLAQFIDKDNMPYFIRGSSANYLSYLIIAAGVIIAVLIFFLKKRGIVA